MSACDNYKCKKKASYSIMRRAEQENAETFFQLMHAGCDDYMPTWATKELASATADKK